MTYTIDTAALQRRFHPIFARIAEQAADRDRERTLAHEAIGWLRDAGFGALRVPVEYGGLGASIEQLFELLRELAAADSNLAQALRAHFGFIDRLLIDGDAVAQARWLPLAGRGLLFGNATTETGSGASEGVWKTSLRPAAGGGWQLDGDKFYSTGTLYADWITVAATQHLPGGGTRQVIALVRRETQGVVCEDDWDGFGQRLSASGTTRFAEVAVPDDAVIVYPRDQPSALVAYFQLVHLATLAGIAQGLEREAADYVRPRQRTFSHGSGTLPRHDPLVQLVVGQLSATSYVATATVRALAAALGELARQRAAGLTLSRAQLDDVELQAAKAQVGLVDSVLQAATRLFDVGGASAISQSRGLDRHWRNARTLASHNPVPYKARALGDHVLNGTAPTYYWNVGTVAPTPAAAETPA